MKVSLRNLNEYIKESYDTDFVTMYKGPGYFYFISDDPQGYAGDIASLYIYAMNQMAFGKWTDHIDGSMQDAGFEKVTK